MTRRLLNLLTALRVFRHLFTLCSAVSGVLLVVVLAIWVCSYFRVDDFYYQPRIDNALHLYRVTWVRGRLSMGMFAAERRAISRLYWHSFVPSPAGAAAPDPDETHFLGVRLLRRTEYVWHPPASVEIELWDRPSSARRTASLETSGPTYTKVREMGISLPCWQAAVLSACLPANSLLRRRRRQIGKLRLERGQCVRCGYDLRASPDRCSECGTNATAPV
jgi:hypothetical protein